MWVKDVLEHLEDTFTPRMRLAITLYAKAAQLSRLPLSYSLIINFYFLISRTTCELSGMYTVHFGDHGSIRTKSWPLNVLKMQVTDSHTMQKPGFQRTHTTFHWGLIPFQTLQRQLNVTM